MRTKATSIKSNASANKYATGFAGLNARQEPGAPKGKPCGNSRLKLKVDDVVNYLLHCMNLHLYGILYSSKLTPTIPITSDHTK